ncbi:MAG: phosphatase PAP2 family protein [Deltaproteobacteria bacterium]|nr:phosphatase PAP2 family protein [Deltaproteobacteria bacterium]
MRRAPTALVLGALISLGVATGLSAQVRADVVPQRRARVVAAATTNPPRGAAAQPASPPSGRATPAAAAPRRRVVWNEAWPRVRVWEYVASGVSYTGVLALELSGRPIEANWEGNFLLDFAVRDAVGTRDPDAVSAWALVSDIPYFISLAYPTLDALVVAGLVWGDWDVAWQMIAMGLEAYAVTIPLIFVTQYFVHRERPYSRFCDSEDPHADCGTSQETQSFPSGHVALASTAAGLTCAHHSRLPLYGGGAGDVTACVTSIGAAVLTGVARIAVDSHYLTDVLVGLGIGAFAGYAVPVLLHYGMRTGQAAPRPATARARRAGVRLAVLPLMRGDTLGVAAFGTLD